MKRRHPRQIVDVTKFVAGEEYALIRATFTPDAPQQTFVSCEPMIFVAALDNGNMQAVQDALSQCHIDNQMVRLTTHDIHGEIVTVSWRGDGALLEQWTFSSMDGSRQHLIFVLAADWMADQRVHVTDWWNPDDICEAGMTWTEEEAKLKRRHNDALRKLLGFDD